MDAALAKVLVEGGIAGIAIGLIWLLWNQGKAHEAMLSKMVSQDVYDDLCKQRDRQSDLLSDLTRSVAILVDRREAAR